MTEKLLTEMSYEEMEALIDQYIDRSSQQSEEMPANAFLALLAETIARRRAQTVEIEGRLINGRLVLLQPNTVNSGLYVQNNQIVIGEQRISVKLLA
jgi:hypothetical protein